MPPKPKSPVKGKKPKQTKAEKERQKKEEAERKLREEEEARLKAEQEEKEHQEKERLENEERSRIEAEEKEQHTAEVTELGNILHGNATALQNVLEERRSKAKWDRYMLCNGTPDPTVPGEINAYINLWKEDKDRNHIDYVLDESKLTLLLIEEVEEHIKSLTDEELLDPNNKFLQDTVTDLEALISHKLDEASLQLLKKASDLADTETGNLQIVHSSPQITLMMWGNLTKNPRFKAFEFEGEKQGFELPKHFALSDVAVRMIKTKYDHYSHHCKTYQLKKKKAPPIVEVKEEEKIEDDLKEGAPDTEENTEGLEENENINKEENNEVNEEENKEKESATPAPEATPQEEEEPKVDQEGDAVEEEKKEDEEEDEDEYDEDEEEDEDVVILRAYQVLGGVMTFEILDLPPQPKTVKNWIMTQVASDELKFVQYPSNSDSKLNGTLSGTLPMGQTLDPKAMAGAEMLGAPPIGVTLRLPDDVLYSEEPQVAYWCPEGKHWRLDGSIDIKYDEENNMLSFKTIKSGPFACIQDRHINMPFQSWELQPLGLNHAKLTIIAAIIEAEIEIKGEVCCFRQTPDTDPKPQLEFLQNKWMSPQKLIEAMFNVGINLFPEPDSKKYVSVQEKDFENEVATYRQMALTASYFTYSYSKWNTDVGRDRIILQGCENLSETPPADDQWSVLMISSHRAMKLRITEDDQDFSEDFAEGTQFHADLYHMVCDLSTDAGRERMRQSDFMFVNAVSQWLEATRLLTYA
ncbi:dynein axonemal intermediate chain 7 homolog [Antedon mediterranea]|uniref:dynein axonemal intermediate chain 7 homolog n=1 Tax=Antedon mediterranea TaxID=105859 RepID=UPI003AF4DDD2